MATDKGMVVEEYVIACLRAGHLLSITEINEGDETTYGEGPVYTHFGGIDGLRIAALAEAFAWTQKDQEAVLEEYDLSSDDVFRLRAT